VKEKIKKSVFWVVWSRGGMQTVSFFSTLFVARILNPEDFGLMALASIWVHVIGLMAEMGFGAAIIQYRDLVQEELNACFWLSVGMGGTGFLGLYITAPMIAAWFGNPELSQVMRVIAFALPLVAIRMVPDGLLKKRLALDKVSQATLLASVIGLIVTLSIALAGGGVWALVAGMLANSLVVSFGVFICAGWVPGFRFKTGRLKEILQFSLSTVGSRFCWSVYTKMDVVSLGKVAGEASVGMFSMAKEIATLPISKITEMVNAIGLPVLATLQNDLEKMRTSTLRLVRTVATITLPICVGIFLEAEDFVRLVLTEKWIAIVPIVQILSCFAFIKALVSIFPNQAAIMGAVI